MNEFVFDDTDFMPAEVTDQPEPHPEPTENENFDEAFGSRISSSTLNGFEEEEEESNLNQTLESIRPLPKAQRNRLTTSRRVRKRRSSAIVTDPENMEALAQEKHNKKLKEKKNSEPKKNEVAHAKTFFEV